MSDSSPASKRAKTMSSRLLTMKFMQRAAASSAEEPETPSPKRQRLSSASNSRPETPNSDLEAVHAAIAAEEQKRAEAVARQAAEAGETNWVLDFSSSASSPVLPSQPPMIVAADSLDAENQGMEYGGRTSFGNFQRKKKHTSVNADEDESQERSPTDVMADKQRKGHEKKGNKKDKKSKKDKKREREKITSISGER